MQKTVKSRNHDLVLFNPYIEPLSGGTTLGQSGPGSDGNEGVLHILQRITGTPPSDDLVSYQDTCWVGGVLPLCWEAVGVFYSPSQLGKNVIVYKLLFLGRNNPIYPTPPPVQDMTQGQFLSRVWQVWIQSFHSPRLVASPRLKNPVCPTIYP